MQYNYIKELKHFIDVIESLIEDDEKYREDIDELDGLKKDIRHIYEFGGIDAIDMMKLASVFRNKLKERRSLLDNHKIIKRIIGIINNNCSFSVKDIKNEISNVEKEISQDRNYFARSELGQALINEFSSDGDDLVTTANEEELQELMNKYK